MFPSQFPLWVGAVVASMATICPCRLTSIFGWVLDTIYTLAIKHRMREFSHGDGGDDHDDGQRLRRWQWLGLDCVRA
ncbi:hypothetical protein [Pararhizobium sp. A13]|uniref:hypothetical protein n=1 Tax=Pararhizobium sp. A13 TaxID=3133975 RepID=UPI00311AF7D1